MQYIPGSSVTLSASLSALRHQHLPDDSNLQTSLPQICVDYLSHDWAEEDVWKSWRSMTRHKNEVTNGVRLENASWRTWWKQRNKLRTISPETLNWLKDSDVTWLYGPLHTADPVPPPRISTTEERFNLVQASGKKPILKHRTISDMLNLPLPEHMPLLGASSASPILEAVSLNFDESDEAAESPERPPLYHTKSDTDILRRTTTRRDSPPRAHEFSADQVDAPPHVTPTHLLSRAYSNSSRSGTPMSEGLGSGSGGSGTALAPPPKKHISFNTFVEQCISIDEPINVTRQRTLDNSDTDDDDDLSSTSSGLEIQHPSHGEAQPPLSRSNSISSHILDHVTIAPIAPTLLKTSQTFPAPSPGVIFAPPQGSNYSYLSSSESTSSSSSSSEDLPIVDFSFVPPQWGRPTAAVQPAVAVAPPVVSPVVGRGALGPAGPSDVFNAHMFQAVQPQGYDSAMTHQQYIAAITSHHQQGMNAGRSRWVDDSAIEEEDEDAERSDSSADEPSGVPAIERDSEDESEEDEESRRKMMFSGDYFRGPDLGVGDEYSSRQNSESIRGGPPSTISTTSSSTTSATTVVPDVKSPIRPNSRAVPPPSKGILKHPGTPVDPSGLPSASSAPIGIPHSTLANSNSTAPSHPGAGGPIRTSFVLPDTSVLSASPTGGPTSPPQINSRAVAGHLDSTPGGPLAATQMGGNTQPASSYQLQQPLFTGRGRSSARTSSSISDRSRSSSKNAGTSSPIGSVSPSGYGSPSGSRANSMLSGNRRTSTDVGRSRGREPRDVSASHSGRPNSLSPPFIGSSGQYSATLNGAPTPSPAAISSQPISSSSPPRSLNAATQSFRLPQSTRIPSVPPPPNVPAPSSNHSSHTPSTPSLTASSTPSSPSTLSSASSSTTTSLRKTSPPGVLRKKGLPNGVRPTVIISHKVSVPSGPEGTGGSSAAPETGGSPGFPDVTLVGVDEMQARKMDDYWADKPPTPATASSVEESSSTGGTRLNGWNSSSNGNGSVTNLDSDSDDDVKYEEFYSTNPTPSNSPVFGIKKLSTGSMKPVNGMTSGSSKGNVNVGVGSTPNGGSPNSESTPRIYGPGSKASASSATVTTSSASASTSSPTRNQQVIPPVSPTQAVHIDPETGLVGKAVDIVSSARELLGAIWNVGTVRSTAGAGEV